MKKWLLIGGIAFVAVLGVALISAVILGGLNIVKAQAPTPEVPYGQGNGWMMGTDTPMRDYMHAALAEKLGLTVDELEAEIADGNRVWELAEAQGMTVDEIEVMMIEARAEALKQMVADGVITQEQADWMNQRMALRGMRGGCGMFGGGGMMRGNDEVRGRWNRQQNNP